MLRIFLTGDNHIGLKYASHEKADTLANARISAFKGMVDAANSENCSLFVVAGDLFENTYNVPKKDIAALAEILCTFNGMVVVLPGNHDYYGDDVKVWQYFKSVTERSDKILLLSDYRPYELTVDDECVVLYPALCTSLHSAPGENNLDWIKNTDIPTDDAYRIGIAHGAVEGETIDNEGQYFLMKRSELEAIPLDLWLIGHTHVPFPKNLTQSYSDTEAIFNAGTHVQTDVSCNTEGGCFIIEVSPEKHIRAKRFIGDNLRFYRKNIDATSEGLRATVIRELSSLPDNSVVDLIISGAVCASEYEDRAAIVENALSRFIEGTYNTYSLSKLISKDLIDAEFPETSFSAALLSALMDDPKEAQLAYEMLKSLKK